MKTRKMVSAMLYDSQVAECAIDVSIYTCDSVKGYYEQVACAVPDWVNVLGKVEPGEYVMFYSDCSAMFHEIPDLVVVREGGLSCFFYRMED